MVIRWTMQELLYCSLYIYIFSVTGGKLLCFLFFFFIKKRNTFKWPTYEKKKIEILRGDDLNARTLFPTILLAQDGKAACTRTV